MNDDPSTSHRLVVYRNTSIALFAGLLIACGSAPTPPPATDSAQGAGRAATPADLVHAAGAVDHLYDELEAQTARFDEALELILADDLSAGEAQLASTAAAIRGLTDLCLRQPGCDAGRLFSTYDYLLDKQRDALSDLHVHLDSLEPMLIDPEAEETGMTYADPISGTHGEHDPAAGVFGDVDLREAIVLNGPVQAALDDWLTWLRPQLMSTYHNYQFLRPTMAPIYEEAELPEAILFGILAAESGGKVHSYSRAGAVGPLQFISSTGRAYGLTQVNGFDLRLDPEAATRANVAYLEDQLAALDNDLEKVLAAYNGGEYRMRRIHRANPGAGFFDRKVYYQFPRETREYVPRVLAAALLFLEPAKYGLVFPSIDTTTVTRTFATDIAVGELAICLGQEGNELGWFRTLRNLNPRVEANERIAAGTPVVMPASLEPIFEARCRDGELIASARRLFDANYPEQPEMIPYTVRKGDSLGRIAARYPCVSLRELAAINRVRPPRYLIRTGQRLNIPACG